MDETSFDALAAEAAAGLKGDRELYLEIKTELQTHLEDKAAHFARAGHDEAESITLAKKSFGSPLDMAAELLRGQSRAPAPARAVATGCLRVDYPAGDRAGALSGLWTPGACLVDANDHGKICGIRRTSVYQAANLAGVRYCR